MGKVRRGSAGGESRRRKRPGAGAAKAGGRRQTRPPRRSAARGDPGPTCGPPVAEATRPRTAAGLAKLLAAGDGAPEVPAKLIRAHIRAGAPVDDRGHLSLAAYAAWLVQRLEADA